MNCEIWSQERIDSIRDAFHSSLELAFANLNGELVCAQDAATLLRDRVSLLEEEKNTLQKQQESSVSELRDLRRQYGKLSNAHTRLTEQARAMKDWIIQRASHDDPVKPEVVQTPLLRSFASNNGYSESRITAQIEAQRTNDPASAIVPALRSATRNASGEANSFDPDIKPTTTNEQVASTAASEPTSDPATESTESASASGSQGAAGPRAESDSDVPKVVAERVLKRKRSSRKQPYIKPEPLSPPRMPIDHFDLDEINQPLRVTGHELEKHSNSPGKMVTRCASEGAEQVKRFQSYENNRNSSPSRSSRRLQLANEPQIFEDPKGTATDCALINSSNMVESSNMSELPGSKSRRALQPKTPNSRVPMHVNNETSTFRKKPVIKEDSWLHVYGEDKPENGTEKMLEGGPSSVLQELLTPRVDPATPFPSSGIWSSLQPNDSAFARGSGRTTRPSSDSTSTRTPIKKPRKTLRMRPREELRPEDFRHNPERNNGLDYAFSEVVRGREQRRCLPGCTRPECCGHKFNRVVEIGGLATPSGPNLGEVLRGRHKQLESDEQILRNYLGESADRLEYMSSAERNDVLQKAKTQAFAQMHGKHRHQHARPTTPPGFWRTDMPSTQEEKMDKEMVEAQRQQVVDERMREALRVGGKWVFRDEYPRSV